MFVSKIVALCLLLIVPMTVWGARPFAQCSPGHPCIDDHFIAFWEENGGLPVFGYAITSANNEYNRDVGAVFLTQWLERNRVEWHPENSTPYAVLLGRLGDERLLQLGRNWQTFQRARPTAPYYFPETGHAIAPEFWEYWRSHGLNLGDQGISMRESLALFGYPLSEPMKETNSSGDTVLAQWFERARFEWHPTNPAGYQVLLGRLGDEVYSHNQRPEPTPRPTSAPTSTPNPTIAPPAPTRTQRPTPPPTPTLTATPPPRPTSTPTPSITPTPPPTSTVLIPTTPPPTSTVLIPTNVPTVEPTQTLLPLSRS